jgi:hypothetical protein
MNIDFFCGPPKVKPCFFWPNLAFEFDTTDLELTPKSFELKLILYEMNFIPQ